MSVIAARLQPSYFYAAKAAVVPGPQSHLDGACGRRSGRFTSCLMCIIPRIRTGGGWDCCFKHITPPHFSHDTIENLQPLASRVKFNMTRLGPIVSAHHSNDAWHRQSTVKMGRQLTSCVAREWRVTLHAASSGFLASPNPIAAISAARAAGKGLL